MRPRYARSCGWTVILAVAASVSFVACDGDNGEDAPARLAPNDPLFARQWHLENTGQDRAKAGADVKAPYAWATGATGAGITIAVIDDGIDTAHEDLRDKLVLVPGSDVADKDDDPRGRIEFLDYHGTSVAGVAAAQANNSTGVAGAAYDASLMPFRFISFGATLSDAATAFRTAGDRGADILSNSWGPIGPFPLPDVVRSAIDHVTDKGRGGRGSLVLFAAGNSAEDVGSNGFASYDRVIAVAASTDQDTAASYSNFGAQIDVAAPSNGGQTTGIWTTDYTGLAGYNATQIPAGDYIAGVNSWIGTVDYRLEIGSGGPTVGETEDNSRLATANPVAVPAVVLATADDPASSGDLDPYETFGPAFADLFRFTVPAGQQTNLLLRGVGAPAGADIDLVLADTRGGILAIGARGSTFEAVPTTGGGDDQGNYANDFGGTSSACPLTAGVVGLILQANPALHWQQVYQVLTASADKIGSGYDSNGHSPGFGFGRINAYEAVKRARTTKAAGPSQAGSTAAWPVPARPGSPRGDLYWYSGGIAHALALDLGAVYARRHREAPALRRAALRSGAAGREGALGLLGARVRPSVAPSGTLADYGERLRAAAVAAGSEVELAPALSTAGGMPLWLGQDLVVGLLPGSSLPDLARLLTDCRPEVAGVLAHGEYRLHCTTGGLAPLATANALYESGLVRYAHPDFQVPVIGL